jgi:hypothetical protein
MKDATLPGLSRRRRLLVVLLAITTAITVVMLLLYPPGGVDRSRRAPAGPANCAPGQTTGCVGGSTAVIVPAGVGAAASAAASPAR